MLVLIVGGVVLAALLLIPLPHAFSQTLSGTAFTPGRATIDPPRGSTVSGSYAATGNSAQFVFYIVDSFGVTVYSSGTNAGSFSFVAALPPYTFIGSGNVTITGTISYPLL